MNAFAARRKRFLEALTHPVVLFAGAAPPRNYVANPYPFRADSNFLYFFERPEAQSAACFDPADGTVTLFLPERTLDDAIWHGPVESFEEAKVRHGVDAVMAVTSLEPALSKRLVGRNVWSVGVPDEAARAIASRLCGKTISFADPGSIAPPTLVDLMASLRMRKDADELAFMRETARVTCQAHVAAMKATRLGASEQVLAGIVEGTFLQAGCVPAYLTILSTRGEVLHNHSHGNTLRDGDLILLDAGAEDLSGYCSDVTRCWPASGVFSAPARDIYDVVLAAQIAAIDKVRPGVRYKDVHHTASLKLAEGLCHLKLLKGSPEDAVDSGAHAVFFPHGVGHAIGLDVHDMEAFGDRVHYPIGRTRSTQFGTRNLRLDVDLADGMTVTIEPGLYFVPGIIHSATLRAQFAAQVDFARAETYLAMNDGRGFGGVRIEDDVRCTSGAPEVLTAAIPKERRELEALVGNS